MPTNMRWKRALRFMKWKICLLYTSIVFFSLYFFRLIGCIYIIACFAVHVESDRLMVDLTALEAQAPGSRVVYPGRCHLCGLGQCSRALQQPCRHPEQLRYSIESLGGDVGKTTEQLLGYGLQWLRQGQLPEYLSLVGGVLYR